MGIFSRSPIAAPPPLAAMLPQTIPSEAASPQSPQSSAVSAAIPRVPPAGISDRILIEAAHRGDRFAFAAIIQRHQGAVYGYLRSHLVEAADAEDLCQEAFLRSYTATARFDSSVMIRPWLIGIARNLLREHVRRVKRRKEVAWTELCLQLEELVAWNDRHYDEAIGHLPDCLDSLGPSARQALDLRYQARLRLSEIGEKLHRSEGAIKLLMFRARAALKHCLDGKIRNSSPS